MTGRRGLYLKLIILLLCFLFINGCGISGIVKSYAAETAVDETDSPDENKSSGGGVLSEEAEAEIHEEQMLIGGLSVKDFAASLVALFLIALIFGKDKTGKKKKILTKLFGKGVAETFSTFEVDKEKKQ